MNRLDAGPYALRLFGFDILTDTPEEISALLAEQSAESRNAALHSLLGNERSLWHAMTLREKQYGKTERARAWARCRRVIEAVAPDIDLNENN